MSIKHKLDGETRGNAMKRIRGDRLRELREQMALTQDDLAEKIGVGVQQINRYENQKTEPDGEMLARLSIALDVGTDYLLGLTDDPTPPKLSSPLSAKEYAVISAWRRGERMKAIKVIAGDE